MTSLRARLLVGTCAAVGGALLLSGLALQALVRERLTAELDRGLVASAQTAASLVEADGDELELEDIDLAAAAERGAFLQVATTDGRPLYRSPSLGAASLTTLGPGPVDRGWLELPGGARGRAVAVRFRPRREHRRRPAPHAEELVLVLARDSAELDRTLATLQGLLGLVGLGTLVVTGGVLVLVVRRSLAPLGAVADQVAAIGEERLDARLRIDDAPDELQPAVARVNELLARLEGAFARERAFSSEVAHELRTPLAGLRTLLEVDGARPRTPEERAATHEDALAIALQLQRMVERLLELARLDASRSHLRREPVRLADAVLEAWRPFAAPAAARGLRVEWALDPELEVPADAVLVDLALRNLLENAVVHADEGGRVRIAVAAEAGTARLEVTNSGSLLDQEATKSATRRFWRGEAARTEAGVRCGLGLALVERAAAALGGQLVLTSTRGGDFRAAVLVPGARTAS